MISSVLLALAPGPDNLYVLSQSVQRGFRAGAAITAGLCTGLCGHASVVALGVATMIQRHQAAMATLNFVGGVYLLYLSMMSIRSFCRTTKHRVTAEWSQPTIRPDPTIHSGTAGTFRQDYFRGCVMNLTNPKVMIFFIAYLPSFIGDDDSPIARIIALGTVFAICTALVFGGIAWFAGAVARRLDDPRLAAGLNLLTGVVLGLVALSLFYNIITG